MDITISIQAVAADGSDLTTIRDRVEIALDKITNIDRCDEGLTMIGHISVRQPGVAESVRKKLGGR